MTTHYNSASRGPVEIASMRYEHALNARDKLAREDKDGERTAERDALAAHIASIEAMAEESDNG
jgi:hypothetical protein